MQNTQQTSASINLSSLFMKELSKCYTQFKIGLLNLIGNEVSPLQIMNSQIFNEFQKIIYPQTRYTQSQNKNFIDFSTDNNKRNYQLTLKKQSSFKSYFSKYEIHDQNGQNIFVIQAERRSHSLSKYDRIKYQYIKNQKDIEIKMDQLIQQNNVQFVIFQNLRQKYKQNIQEERQKFMSLFLNKDMIIGVCKDCLKIKEVENSSRKVKDNNFKSEIIQTQQQTISEQQSQNQDQQALIKNVKQLQELVIKIQTNLMDKNQPIREKYQQIIKKILKNKFQLEQSFLYNSNKNKKSNTKSEQSYQNKICDSFCQTQNLQHSFIDQSKTIGQRQLTLLIKQKQLNKKVQEWKQQIQNVKKNYHDKQLQLKQKEKEMQIYLNGKLIQLDIKSQEIMQLNGNKSRMNSIADLKNRLQLDSYRRNALINIERDQIQLLIQKQNITCLQNIPKKAKTLIISQLQKKTTNKQEKICFQINNVDKGINQEYRPFIQQSIKQ